MVKKTDKTLREQTRMMQMGRDPEAYYGIVNPPICRTSTILYPSLAAYEDPTHNFRYGRVGNPMSKAFEDTITEMEKGYGAITTPSGLTSITTSLLAFANSGDHVLVVDCIYPPVRAFCDTVLSRMGIDIEYYDPLIGSGIKDKLRDNTSVVYMESPGSGIFEVMDVPAIVDAVRGRDITTIIDNTWAAGYLFNPIEHGVNISAQAATKYIAGHSDVNLGVAVADSKENYERLKLTAKNQGINAAAEDMYLAFRGLRTMAVRMPQNESSALKVIEFLKGQLLVKQVFHPALEGHPGHEVWKRDFRGANGVLSFLLQDLPKPKVHEFVDSLELFPVGDSWGGYESLLQPQFLKTCRTAVPWIEDGYVLRLQIGLEDVDDLIEDLKQGFERLAQD